MTVCNDQCFADAPAVLSASCRDDRLRELFGTPKVALVGEPFYSDYAHRITYRLAADLAEAGVTVTAVLCNGVDSIALDGAMRAGGATLAIEPGVPGRGARHQSRPGLDRLHERIAQTGAVVWGCWQRSGGFKRTERTRMTDARRLQAAIADAVVVVEARERSIALFTAERAADFGHDVAVVPGRVTDPGGHGAFELLRDGAYPVRDADDVLELIAAHHRTAIPAEHQTPPDATRLQPALNARQHPSGTPRSHEKRPGAAQPEPHRGS